MDNPDSAATPWPGRRADGKSAVRVALWICSVVAVIGLLSAGAARLGALFPQESAGKLQVSPGLSELPHNIEEWTSIIPSGETCRLEPTTNAGPGCFDAMAMDTESCT